MSEIPGTDAGPGGGGFAGLAATFPATGAPLIAAMRRLRWCGNGRGGGVALVGCFPHFPHHYALNIALLQSHTRREIEQAFVTPNFDVADVEFQAEMDDHYGLAGLAGRPPRVVRYFVRAAPAALGSFAAQNNLDPAAPATEDEFVYQAARRINRRLYASGDERTAFVLSFGRDMMILKGPGDADAVAQFYCLDGQRALVWLGYQHAPTHTLPGCAPPFAALDGAVALNGSFANRRTLAAYVEQRGYRPHFHTDGELASILFDYYSRACRYRQELVFEALAPTPPAGLDGLSADRRTLYRALHHTHAHGIPEGAVFSAIAARLPQTDTVQLAGVAGAHARRPNVFAMQTGVLRRGEHYGVGAVASEYQAVEAMFETLAAEHSAVCAAPDRAWVAHDPATAGSDGGAYVFTLARGEPGGAYTLTCKDKFGRLVAADYTRTHRAAVAVQGAQVADDPPLPGPGADDDAVEAIYAKVAAAMPAWTFAALEAWLDRAAGRAAEDAARRGGVIALLVRLYDRAALYDTGAKKPGAVRARLLAGLVKCFGAPPVSVREAAAHDLDRRLDWMTLTAHGLPLPTRGVLYIDAADLPPEGESRPSRVLAQAYHAGWRRFVMYNCKGDRSIGAGLGPGSQGARIDVFGAAGDYLAAGLDGAAVHVHGPAPNQAGYMMQRGRLVIYGDAVQDLCHAARGGEAFVLGFAGARAFATALGAFCAAVNGVRAGETAGAVSVFPGDALDAAAREKLLRDNAALFDLAGGG